MRVVVTGATGNVGTAVVAALAADPAVDSIVGVARRRPELRLSGVSWYAADVGHAPLDVVEGADAIVHLAWRIQPERRPEELVETNVVGTRRVIDAAVRHGVPRVVVASSVGAYSPGPQDSPVDESWPTDGIRTSRYSRHKATVEHMLDDVQALHPQLTLVRMRTSLVFQRRAGAEVHRLFLGPLVPHHLPGPLRFVPSTAALRFQATHAADIGEAYRLAVHDGHGAYNVAADPVLDADTIAQAVGGRTVPVPEAALRAGAGITYRLRLQRASLGWADLALRSPLMDSARIRRELGWSPTTTSVTALQEVLAGMGARDGARTPPLHPGRGGADLGVPAVARGPALAAVDG